MISSSGRVKASRANFFTLLASFALLLAVLLPSAGSVHADEPYAPSKEYDLSSIRTHLWFDLAQKKIRGEVSENIAALRDDLSELTLDSEGLTINSVTVDGKTANFSTVPGKL